MEDSVACWLLEPELLPEICWLTEGETLWEGVTVELAVVVDDGVKAALLVDDCEPLLDKLAV